MRTNRIILAALLSFTFLTTTHAEVSAFPDPVSGEAQPIVLGSVVDDIDPVGSIWNVHTNGDPRFRPLNPNGLANGDGPPTVTWNPVTDEPFVGWSSNRPSGYELVYSVFRDDGWVTTIQAPDANRPDEFDPSITVTPDGRYHLVYWTRDGTIDQVWYRTAPPDLSSWSTPERVSQIDETASYPSIVFHNGQPHVVYESHSSGQPIQIVLSIDKGSGFQPQLVATTLQGDGSLPGIHSHAGVLWIDWIDFVGSTDPATGEVAWTRKLEEGGWTPIRIESYGNRQERDYHVRGRIRGLAIQ